MKKVGLISEYRLSVIETYKAKALIREIKAHLKEYSFEDLKDKKKLRFDFAIFDKNNKLIKLIEFDGR